MLLRARIVLPISSPAIENGAVRVAGNRIQTLGRWGDPAHAGPMSGEEVIDFGESILLPGLINAHCHLDYTDMAGQIAPQKTFPDWIKAILALKAAWGYSDFARSWANGAKMLMRSGVTTVLDVEAVPELLPDVWSVTPMRVISFREIISLRKTQESDFQLAQAAAQWAALGQAGRGVPAEPLTFTGLSPHAPYTTHADALRWAARTAQARNWLLTTHVAESQDEFDMFRHASGAMCDWLKTQRDMSDCGRLSPVQHLEESGYLSDRLIAVHANYLEKGDADLLASRGVHLVHCPRSHAYFRHAPFSYDVLSRAGVNVCLGTDSLASVKRTREPLELNLFAEMRAFASAHPDLSPETVLQMVTLNPARALGQTAELGQLSPNALADVIGLEYTGSVADAPAALLERKPKLVKTIINGIVH